MSSAWTEGERRELNLQVARSDRRINAINLGIQMRQNRLNQVFQEIRQMEEADDLESSASESDSDEDTSRKALTLRHYASDAEKQRIARLKEDLARKRADTNRLALELLRERSFLNDVTYRKRWLEGLRTHHNGPRLFLGWARAMGYNIEGVR
ncbi:unnamed protein product [Zymoseptoria tritici ST99CH_3D1]|uniref:Uncharacterized protein n=1 Tax=Zymoseptoria tritici (strain ST99CH_3D7) TaxID=1276538 RepID=A0A1X7RVC9_ZYMT9|nr:unnamed protein product [Zymoseptoria tritici ST99CH_3D7]SMR54916.1 unnamed protein product [Zymoseptoria tritici ST99CH_3D1]